MDDQEVKALLLKIIEILGRAYPPTVYPPPTPPTPPAPPTFEDVIKELMEIKERIPAWHTDYFSEVDTVVSGSPKEYYIKRDFLHRYVRWGEIANEGASDILVTINKGNDEYPIRAGTTQDLTKFGVDIEYILIRTESTTAVPFRILVS
jgi:hypothetical protein